MKHKHIWKQLHDTISGKLYECTICNMFKRHKNGKYLYY